MHEADLAPERLSGEGPEPEEDQVLLQSGWSILYRLLGWEGKGSARLVDARQFSPWLMSLFP